MKKMKLKFKDQISIDLMAQDLKALNDIEVIDYKVTGPTDFSVSFSKKFAEYYNINRDRLQHHSVNNMVSALGQFPREKIGIEDFTTMFYSTVLLTFIQETGQYSKINIQDIERIGNLIVTVESLHDMLMENLEKEDKE